MKTRIARLERKAQQHADVVSLAALDLPSPHDTQRRIISEARRFNVACLGRRSGKSTLGIRLLIEPALRGQPTAWFSPTYKNLVDLWRGVRSTLYPIAERISEAEHRIDLRGGGVVEMWSLEKPDAIRGRRYARAIIDEAAMVKDLSYAWATVIRPTLVDLTGDAFFLSTPKGRNAFWDLWYRAEGDSAWARWQMPSACNPYLPTAELEAMKRELPERVYQQEVEAQFLDNAGAIFRNVQLCVTAEPMDAPAVNDSYVFGVDWAGGAGGDSTVIIVMAMASKRVVALHRSNTATPSQSLSTLESLAVRWKPTAIVAEQNSIGMPLVEQLQRRGLPVQPFVTTNSSKAQIIDSLILAFEQQQIAILDDSTLIAELLAFEQRKSPLGAPIYAAPTGMHDDCVIALALAHSACSKPSFLVWGVA